MENVEVLKAVFPLLDGQDLASCMIVSKQWRDIARDDYFWKCLCGKKWPSVCKRSTLPTTSYRKLYQAFYKRKREQTLLPPRLSFSDLEFYIDIWNEDKLIFSEVISGPALRNGIKILPNAIYHIEGPEFKMVLPVEPKFIVPIGQTVSVSMLVGRQDSDMVACIINKSIFEYIDHTAYRALAFDYLDFSPAYPFVSGIRAWISLLFSEHENDDFIDVFGIEMDFCDAASTEEEFLWLLDMLDLK